MNGQWYALFCLNTEVRGSNPGRGLVRIYINYMIWVAIGRSVWVGYIQPFVISDHPLFDVQLYSNLSYSTFCYFRLAVIVQLFHCWFLSTFSYFALQLFYVQLVDLWLFDIEFFAVQLSDVW
jgi:hypothetical protein